jgi:hypothetical protein
VGGKLRDSELVSEGHQDTLIRALNKNSQLLAEIRNEIKSPSLAPEVGEKTLEGATLVTLMKENQSLKATIKHLY